MSEEITYIPDLKKYDRMIKAKKDGGLILFAGAGVSMPMAPDWNGFAKNVWDGLIRQDKPPITYATKEILSSLLPKKQLSIAKQIAKVSNKPIDFHAALNHSKGTVSERHRLLWSISDKIITTNYDLLFEQNAPAGKCKPLYRRDEMKIGNLTPKAVMHIHGSLDDPDNMVVSTSDYLRHYEKYDDKENPYLTLLEELFRNKCVLFVGYGLEELEILEYVFLKGRCRSSAGQRHFILLPFFSNQTELVTHLKTYFENECGVTLIPYCRDLNDYAQLDIILERWKNELPDEDMLDINKVIQMEALLDD